MPTTTQYIPSEIELKEMGFSHSGFKKYWYFPLKQVTIYFDTHKGDKWSIWVDDRNSISLFPIDKAHLQSIILAFQPK